MVVADWIRRKTAEERNTMIRQARFARWIVVFGCIIMILEIIIIVIPPCFGYSMRYLTNVPDPGKPLLLQTYYLRDITKSPYFEIAFVAQAIAVVMMAFSYTAIDNFMLWDSHLSHMRADGDFETAFTPSAQLQRFQCRIVHERPESSTSYQVAT